MDRKLKRSPVAVLCLSVCVSRGWAQERKEKERGRERGEKETVTLLLLSLSLSLTLCVSLCLFVFSYQTPNTRCVDGLKANASAEKRSNGHDRGKACPRHQRRQR
jgi:hypothetical protein